MQTVIDDHSCIAHAEIHNDEKATTAIAVLRNTVTWYATHGVNVERVLSDNGPAYKSRARHAPYAELATRPKKPRPYRPQTNAKAERFPRTLADGRGLNR